MFSEINSATLVQDQDIESWIRTLFGSAMGSDPDGVKLIVKVDGRSVGLTGGGDTGQASRDDVRAAIQELTRSLELYGTSASSIGDAPVAAPSAESICKALSALADPAVRPKALGAALAIFGRRVVAPLEQLLDSENEGPTARLTAWRTRVSASIDQLNLARETTNLLRADLDRLLTDNYLAMIGDYEEEAIRPQLTELVQRVLEALGGTFYRALDRFGANAGRIADRIVRTLPRSISLRELPSMLKASFVQALADYLAAETSAELLGTLHTISAQYSKVVPNDRQLLFREDWYQDVARECWNVMVSCA